MNHKKTCFLLLFFSLKLFCQKVEVEYFNHKIINYKTITEAAKVTPDSVKSLDLISNNFKDFPNEILLFKNLENLYIDSYSWHQVLDSLTQDEKKLYYELKANTCDRCGVMKFYKINTIKSIPRSIKKLKKLKNISIGDGVKITNTKKFKRIYRWLPNVDIWPRLEDWM